MGLSLFNFLQSFYGQTSKMLIDAGELTKFANYVLGNTAQAGGPAAVQATAVPLGYGMNEVSSAVSTGSVALPLAIPGGMCYINNNSAQTINIYTQVSNASNSGTGDVMVAKTTVAVTANGTAIQIATGHSTMFYCTTLGTWKQAYDI